MKIQKNILMFVVVFLVATLMSSSVFAAPAWKEEKVKGKEGKAKKSSFSDVSDSEKWATKAIEKMNLKGVIKGTGKGLFEPQRNVTKLEAVIMALRIIGLEEDAQKITEIPDKLKGISVPWLDAFKYLKVASDNEIITEEELLSFNPNQPAKRWEVAKYIVRAMGMEDLAQDNMDAQLTFKDAPAIPADAVGYVYMALDLGIMEGYPNGNFMSNKPVTRAEMAVLIERTDGIVDTPADGREVSGSVESIDEDRMKITVKLANGKTVSYYALEDVSVYKEKEDYIEFEDIDVGETVRMLLNADEKVIFIEVIGKTENVRIEWLRGKVDYIDDEEIEIILRDETKKAFDINEDTEVFINRKKADIDDISKGDSGWFKVQGEKLLEISITKADESEEFEAEGKITRLDFGKLKITLDNDKTYDVDKDVEVKINGEEAEFEELEVGYEAELKGKDNIVKKIKAETEEPEEFGAEGIITRLSFGSTLKITLDNDKTYDVDDDVKVKINGEEAKFEELEEGFQVEIEGEDNIVKKIDAETPEELETEIEGQITAVTRTEGKLEITVETEEGRTYTYEIASNVRLKGDIESLDDLAPGHGVELKLQNGEVVQLDVEIPKVKAKNK